VVVSLLNLSTNGMFTATDKSCSAEPISINKGGRPVPFFRCVTPVPPPGCQNDSLTLRSYHMHTGIFQSSLYRYIFNMTD
jgi:hypothetical protein